MVFSNKRRRVDLIRFHLDEKHRPQECYGYCRAGADIIHGYFEDAASARKWVEAQTFTGAGTSAEAPEDRYTKESFTKLDLTKEQEKLLPVEAYYDHQMRKLVPNSVFLHYEPKTEFREPRVRFTNLNDRQLKIISDLSQYPMIEGFMLYNDGAGITEDGVQTFELMTNEDILAELAVKEAESNPLEYEIAETESLMK